MTDLATLLGLAQHETVAIIGSGGKTTLLWYLAEQFRAEKILVTPTTKLFLPPQNAATIPACGSQRDTSQNRARQNRTLQDNNLRDNNLQDGNLQDNPRQNNNLQDGTPPTSAPHKHRAPRQHTPLYHDHLYNAEAFARLTSALPGVTLTGSYDFNTKPKVCKNENMAPKEGAPRAREKSSSQTLHDTYPESAPLGPKACPKRPAVQKQSPQRRDVPNPENFTHKIHSLPPDILASQRHLFDKVLMESDGARNLPLKGWAPHEPVIPDFTTMTIAVMPLWPVGTIAGDHCIHRAELFYAMAHCQAGETISARHLARVIAHPQGLLAKTKGKRILLLHLQAPSQLPLAKELVTLIPEDVLSACTRIVAGSAQEGWGVLLYGDSPKA